MRKILPFLFSVLVPISFSHAQCMMKEISLNQRISESSLIVEGRVIEKKCFWDKLHHSIYTRNKIEIYKVFNGICSEGYFDLITEGGTVGLDKTTVQPFLNLNVNDIGVFTCIVSKILSSSLDQSSLSKYEAYASSQGFIRYNLQDITASDIFNKYIDIKKEVYDVLTSSSKKNYSSIKTFQFDEQKSFYKTLISPNISNFSPTAITAGTKSTLTINGTGFGSTRGTLGFKSSADGGVDYINPIESEYLSWSDTQIQVEVPSEAGTGTIQVTQGSTVTSSSTLSITYSQLNVSFPSTNPQTYRTTHVNMNTTGGYTWQMYTGFNNNIAAKASFLRSFDSWKCGTLINWTIGATTDINIIAADGINVIRFDIGNELPEGVLGRCSSYWSGCSSGSIWYVKELDIAFDDATDWEYGPALPTGLKYDFESVSLHELGHGHQLGHNNLPRTVMYFSSTNATNNRIIDANDLEGASDVMARSMVRNSCGQTKMLSGIACSLTPCNFIASATTICAGNSITYNDQSNDSPDNWSWTFPGGIPEISNSQNPNVKYNSVGTFSVTLVASNANWSDSKTISITVQAIPTLIINDISSICTGNSTSITANGANTYAWSSSNGLNKTTGSMVIAHPIFTTTYTITGTSGVCSETKLLTIHVNPTPTLSATLSALTICSGSSTTITINGTPGTAFSWAPSGGLSSTNETTLTANPTMTTTYSITGNTLGCSNTINKTIFVYPIPIIPIITQIGDTIISSAATTFEWYEDGILIIGANSQKHHPSKNGNYAVKITNNDGCKASSPLFAFTTFNIISTGEENIFVIFPNPNDGYFELLFQGIFKGNYNLEMKNILGEVISKEVIQDFSGSLSKQMDLSNYGKGVYILSISNAVHENFKKLIVY